jgi:hypothetical protein
VIGLTERLCVRLEDTIDDVRACCGMRHEPATDDAMALILLAWLIER